MFQIPILKRIPIKKSVRNVERLLPGKRSIVPKSANKKPTGKIRRNKLLIEVFIKEVIYEN